MIICHRRTTGYQHIRDRGCPEFCVNGILLRARNVGLIPSFRDSTQIMRKHGIFFNEKLTDRLAATVGE